MILERGHGTRLRRVPRVPPLASSAAGGAGGVAVLVDQPSGFDRPPPGRADGRGGNGPSATAGVTVEPPHRLSVGADLAQAVYILFGFSVQHFQLLFYIRLD